MAKVQKKNIQNAIFPIIILNWLTGFSIIEYPMNKPRPILSFIYISFCIFIYISAYFVDYHHKYKDSNEMRKDIFLYLKHINSVISFSCIIIGWYNYKAWKIILHRINMMDESFMQMGIPHKYHKIFTNILCKIIVWIIFISILICINFQVLLQMLDWIHAVQLIYTLHYPIHINAAVDFTFTAIINCLGMRFIESNLLLRKTLSKARNKRNIKSFHPKPAKICFISSDSNMILEKIEDKQIILLVKSFYKELSDISNEVIRIYEIQIVILIASFFVVLTGFYYIAFAGLFFQNTDVHTQWHSKLSGLLWCVAYTYRVFDINATCGRVSSQAKKTKEILFELKNVTNDEELKCEIDQFSLQITQCPLVFTVCGFFNLDYKFIEKFIGRVLMYTVILIQFSPDGQKLL